LQNIDYFGKNRTGCIGCGKERFVSGNFSVGLTQKNFKNACKAVINVPAYHKFQAAGTYPKGSCGETAISACF
jgi:hypothetical protein